MTKIDEQNWKAIWLRGFEVGIKRAISILTTEPVEYIDVNKLMEDSYQEFINGYSKESKGEVKVNADSRFGINSIRLDSDKSADVSLKELMEKDYVKFIAKSEINS